MVVVVAASGCADDGGIYMLMRAHWKTRHQVPEIIHHHPRHQDQLTSSSSSRSSSRSLLLVVVAVVVMAMRINILLLFQELLSLSYIFYLVSNTDEYTYIPGTTVG